MLDVTDPAQIVAARDTVMARLGHEPLDGLVNNAGVAIGGPVEYLPLEEWRQQFEVNFFGVVETTKVFIELLRRGPGRNVIVGSVSGRLASPMLAPYSASKHAVEALAESLRHELRDWGIRTSVVEPGAVATPIWDKGRAQADRLEHDLPLGARSAVRTVHRSGAPHASINRRRSGVESRSSRASRRAGLGRTAAACSLPRRRRRPRAGRAGPVPARQLARRRAARVPRPDVSPIDDVGSRRRRMRRPRSLRCADFLATDPVAHNVALSILHERVATPIDGRYWWVEEDGAVVGYAWRSPPTFFAGVVPMTRSHAGLVADAVFGDIPD